MAYVWLATALPRSGGDYVFQSRVFGGGFGFTVVFGFFVVWILQWVALSGWLLATVGIAPTFIGLGATTGIDAFTDIGTWAAGANGIIIISVLNAIVALVLLISGFRNYVRFQYVMWYAILLSFGDRDPAVPVHEPNLGGGAPRHVRRERGRNLELLRHRLYRGRLGGRLQSAVLADREPARGPIAWTSLQWATYSSEQGGRSRTPKCSGSQVFIVGSLAATAGLLILLALAMQKGLGADGILVASSGYWYGVGEATIGGNIMFPSFMAMGLTGSWLIVLLIGLGFILNSFQIVCNCYIGTTRIMVAQGLDGLLPDWFARVSPRWKTPVNAHLAYFLAALPVIWAFNKVGDWEHEVGPRGDVRERCRHGAVRAGCGPAPVPGKEAIRGLSGRRLQRREHPHRYDRGGSASCSAGSWWRASCS